jgi:hypothetical protein
MRRHLDRAARVAFAFVMMNAVSVTGLLKLLRQREVWR